MRKQFYKYKLLFDENMPPRTRYQRLNSHFDVKHVKLDLNNAGISDSEVYKLASHNRELLLLSIMTILNH